MNDTTKTATTADFLASAEQNIGAPIEFAAPEPPTEQVTQQSPADYETEVTATPNANEQLKGKFTGFVVTIKKWGITKKVANTDKADMAEVKSANPDRIKASKEIIDPKSEAYKACIAIQNASRNYWKSVTNPHIDDGVRLGRIDKIDDFNTQIEDFKTQLDDAKNTLAMELDVIRETAKADLVELYDPEDYHVNIDEEFSIAFETRSLEMDDSWKDLAPEVYASLKAAAEAKLTLCIEAAEADFVDKLTHAVNLIVKNLNDAEDGKLKQFGPENINRIDRFIERFRDLSIGGNSELDAIVNKAQCAVKGIDVADVKHNVHAQDSLKDSMTELVEGINSLAINRPARKLSF